jgi:glycosyltransferase involved in cell wall biosynthesis
VRRGAEREIHDLGMRLRDRGHRVRLVTTTPRGITQRRHLDGVDVRYVRTPVPRALARRGFTPETTFAAVAAAATVLSGADLVHAWLYGDGYGAAHALRLRRRPLVLKLTGTVRSERIARTPVDDRMFRSAIERADEVWCNSAFAREQMADFGVPMQIVPAGVDLTRFVAGEMRAEVPTVVVASAPDDPRKRLVDLLDAWPGVLDGAPDAQLRVAGNADAAVRADLLSRLPDAAADSVTFLGGLDDLQLVAEYQRAWVVAAPAVHEALGLTTVEALACGTPVAGARSGATPELVTDGVTGALFAPAEPADCATAILRAFTLTTDTGVRDVCRRAAEPYDWKALTDRIAGRYRVLIARS